MEIWAIRIGGTSEFVSKIDPEDPRCSPPGDIETVAGWDHSDMLTFETEAAAELAAIQVQEIDGCHTSVERMS